MILALRTWIERQQKSTLFIVALVLVGLVWSIDYGTGPFLSASIFYLMPINMAAWWVGHRVGAGLSLLSALAWLATDILTNPNIPNPAIHYWNAAVRLGFFLIVTYTLASLRQARQRQEELMSFVVHDLRSPLSNIITGVSMLSQIMEAEESTIQYLVDLAISSGRRMLVQINSLLDLARLENGKLPVQIDSVQLEAMVRESIEQVSLLAQHKGVVWALEGITADTAVLADPTLIERVLINLLGNAIEFSPEKGTITVVAAANDQRLVVRICDEGPGIPMEWEKHVFRKFEQLRARNAGAATGTGLGLAFCKLAVEAQNGRIWLESPPHERGTMVCFSLPMPAKIAED